MELHGVDKSVFLFFFLRNLKKQGIHNMTKLKFRLKRKERKGKYSMPAFSPLQSFFFISFYFSVATHCFLDSTTDNMENLMALATIGSEACFWKLCAIFISNVT